MRLIDAEQVHAALDFGPLVDALERYHRETPPQVERAWIETESEDGDKNGFLIWPAWQPGEALGAKLVTIFPGNTSAAAGLPSVQALYVLFDGRDGSARTVIDGTALTYRKTAADSALGAKYLARADAKALLMVGAGALAPYLIEAHLVVRPSIERVMVWNRTKDKAAALCERIARPGVTVEVVDDLAAAVAAADIVSCATMARAPLIFADWLSPGTHLDLVGAYTTEMIEADAGVAPHASVHVDTRWFTIGHCGDLDRPLEQGLITEADIRGDLFELCRNDVPGRRRADEITLFKNAGGAHLDLMTARFLWESVGG